MLRSSGLRSSGELKSGEVLLVITAAVFALVIVFVIGAVLMGLAHALRSLVRLEQQTAREGPGQGPLGDAASPEGPYSIKDAPDG